MEHNSFKIIPLPQSAAVYHVSRPHRSSKTFLEIGELCTSKPSVSVEEKQAEEHFFSTHYRQSGGSYVLPTKPNICQLGASQKMALKRLEYLVLN
jgi:hypothetical protein